MLNASFRAYFSDSLNAQNRQIFQHKQFFPLHRLPCRNLFCTGGVDDVHLVRHWDVLLQGRVHRVHAVQRWILHFYDLVSYYTYQRNFSASITFEQQLLYKSIKKVWIQTTVFKFISKHLLLANLVALSKEG